VGFLVRPDVDVAIAGDPRRKQQSKRLASQFRSFKHATDVYLMFEKNPACAFNKAISLLVDSDYVVLSAGDIWLTESDFLSLLDHASLASVVFADQGSDSTPERGFCTGLVLARTDFVRAHPFVEWPSFCEEIPYRHFLSKNIGVAHNIGWVHNQGNFKHLGTNSRRNMIRRSYAIYCSLRSGRIWSSLSQKIMIPPHRS
jgi:hypothetical protein